MSSISSVSGQVAVAVRFLTRDPSLIWNTDGLLGQCRLHLPMSQLEQQTFSAEYFLLSKLERMFAFVSKKAALSKQACNKQHFPSSTNLENIIN